MITAHILNIVLWFVWHVSGQYWPFAFISNKWSTRRVSVAAKACSRRPCHGQTSKFVGRQRAYASIEQTSGEFGRSARACCRHGRCHCRARAERASEARRAPAAARVHGPLSPYDIQRRTTYSMWVTPRDKEQRPVRSSRTESYNTLQTYVYDSHACTGTTSLNSPSLSQPQLFRAF